jgi:hypothetical protein
MPPALHLMREHAEHHLLGALDLFVGGSITITGIPALANVIAMPVPIVPAPMTPAASISSGFGRRAFGILPSSRSAKNTCCSARRRRRAHQLVEQAGIRAPVRAEIEIRARLRPHR